MMIGRVRHAASPLSTTELPPRPRGPKGRSPAPAPRRANDTPTACERLPRPASPAVASCWCVGGRGSSEFGNMPPAASASPSANGRQSPGLAGSGERSSELSSATVLPCLCGLLGLRSPALLLLLAACGMRIRLYFRAVAARGRLFVVFTSSQLLPCIIRYPHDSLLSGRLACW